ncbi:MAG: ubiquinone biosynthesis regulatory protein kinase UbiB [Oceanospirillaceae bacterium]|nr:ubiquinone biosynthesis regulatory protein kinase UbiB [Oceanospirillaceae bacterium]
MQRLFRSLKIGFILIRYRLDTFVDSLPLPWYLRILLHLMPWRYLVPATAPRGERLRLALESLGPVFIKFGQVLSTRRDLLPLDVADELKYLQDRVPAFPSDQAIAIIEKALGKPVEELFAEFDPQPLASASVAQVHRTVLFSGEKAVVKVIRPGIDKIIQKDVALLFTLARVIESVWSEGRRLHLVEVVAEYEMTLADELDLRKEAANASQLRRNFEQSPLLYIPEIFWDYTKQNVLVMEQISGIPVADIEQLHAHNVNMKLLAERGVEIFFTQVFRDSFFHADMHPGNIFVSPENGQDPQYIAVDFGIVGSLTLEDQSYLARNLLAFFTRDYRQVAQLHIDSGWVPAATNVTAFETAIRSVCEPIFEKPLKDISFGQVLLGLFQTARRFNMEVQPQLVLLQKTLLNVEGLGRQLYPELDLWQTGKPYLEEWMKERVGPKAVIKTMLQQAPDWIEKLPQLPQLAYDVLQQAKTQQVQTQQLQLQMQLKQLDESNKRRKTSLLAGVCIIAALWFGYEPAKVFMEQLAWQGWVFAVLALYIISK